MKDNGTDFLTMAWGMSSYKATIRSSNTRGCEERGRYDTKPFYPFLSTPFTYVIGSQIERYVSNLCKRDTGCATIVPC